MRTDNTVETQSRWFALLLQPRANVVVEKIIVIDTHHSHTHSLSILMRHAVRSLCAHKMLCTEHFINALFTWKHFIRHSSGSTCQLCVCRSVDVVYSNQRTQTYRRILQAMYTNVRIHVHCTMYAINAHIYKYKYYALHSTCLFLCPLSYIIFTKTHDKNARFHLLSLEYVLPYLLIFRSDNTSLGIVLYLYLLSAMFPAVTVLKTVECINALIIRSSLQVEVNSSMER